ncbi:F-actin-capping protein subunit beta [Scheffersomyces spartinae]|uniref:F-actin-capping protein subunit beta n=1 Tax=Scheffersomyces spartinae TaxID=45513 RepID=A0A9P7VD23_9ASCO|nr:F-actin-capping protein subunit beta [Scheffersomyces spartinae]KAG7195850.1 F-actin-capping protein subunit beta [Scheffersomyces spartinae]
MSYESKFDAALDAVRRLDPKQISSNLNHIISLVQADDSVDQDSKDDLTQDLLLSIDQPLKVNTCKESGKEYLCCDYNRDGDSYRSHWSNKYYPSVDEDAPYPPEHLRQLEIKANDAFDIYRDLYYEGGLSSVYLWESEEDEDASQLLDAGFVGVVLFQKKNEGGKWDSIHVVEVIPETKALALYKITSTVILDLSGAQSTKPGQLSLSGSLIRQLEASCSLTIEGATNLETAHLINLGQLVEKQEYNIRNLLQEVYFDKLKDIFLKDVRSIGDVGDKKLEDAKHSQVIKGLQAL